MDDFPAWLQAARKARGWSQSDLALRLGVGQQAVSSWEHGRTVPKDSVRHLLESVIGAKSDLSGSAVPAVGVPRITDLPLKGLDEYTFEAFCADLAVEEFPGAHVQRFGGRGEKQYGIDVRVVTATRERLGIQAKRYEKYQPASFKGAVEELDLTQAEVERCILMVTAKVSVKVQQEAAKHPEWEIWDADVLSRKVAGLDKDTAVRLVDRYFPGLREPFLGVGAPTPWQTPEEAFDNGRQGDRFSYRWTLVGRTAQLDELARFVEDEAAEAPLIGLLTGAAGTGKSRLLKALCDRLDSTARVVRLAPRETPSPEAFELLPRSPGLVVIIDDAQEHGAGLRTLLSQLRRQRPEAKILLAARPYGLPAVRDALRSLGIDHTAIPTWPLRDLSTMEATSLAAEALGAVKGHLAPRLAHAAKDCPLLLVVGAVQIRDGHLSSSVLQTDEQIRQQLADAFLRTAIPDHAADPVRLGHVLRAVSLLQPFRENVPVYQQALEDLTGQPFYDAAPHLRVLEEAGVLLRRGTSLRVVPDLLGDMVLSDAALLPTTGSPTGYLARAHASLRTAQEPLLHALVNTSRVEWQWSQDHASANGLAEPLWAEVAQAIREADETERVSCLPFLRQVGVFQSGRTLALVKWLYEQQPQVRLHRALPPVLEAVAYDLQHVDEACDLLWDLGRSDARPLNAHPDHALRILTSLASYEVGKPFAYQHAVIEGVSRWAATAQPSAHPRMPLELLDPVFGVEAESTIQEGWTLTFQRSSIPIRQVLGVRRKALDLLFREYAHAGTHRSARAALTFEAVLRNTRAAGDDHVTDVLRELREQTSRISPGPIAAVATRRAVEWNLAYGSDTNQAVAQEVLDALPTSIAHDVAAALHTNQWIHLRHADNQEEAGAAWESYLEATAQATKGWSLEVTWQQLQSLLTEGFDVFGYVPQHAQAFIEYLVEARPELQDFICVESAQISERVQQTVLPSALQALLRHDPQSGLERAKQLIRTGTDSLKRAVATALAERRHGRELPARVIVDLGQELAKDTDTFLRCLTIRAAGPLSRSDHAAAVDLVAAVPLMGSSAVASELCMAITGFGWLSWADLSPQQGASLLRQLVRIENLEAYEVQTVLSTLSTTHSDAVLTLLMGRVEHWEREVEQEAGYVPLPYQWHASLLLSDTPDRIKHLRRILAWTAAPEPGSRTASRREHYAPELFRSAARHSDRDVRALLLDALRSENAQERRAAAILFESLDSDIVWQAPDFVSEALQTAADASDELMRTVGGSLLRSVREDAYVGTPGQPLTEDVEIRDRADRMVATLEPGSVQERFYRSLRESAVHRIAWFAADDPAPDHRVW
ncbi:helix-turn-helix domain-containing protein [Streptomyces bobili]|uniref:P-loop NTPase n=1 Tax=Streptomyces bobili TaxID=67280 RepID=UPI003446DAD6